jgi:inner membrane transporter RhtA
MVWLRLVTSAVILLIMARPRLRGHVRRDWLIVLGFGVSLMTMNWAIYQSFARIPLGIAVTIEFLGPLTVAVISSRRLMDLIWVLLAGAGVALLGFSKATLSLAGLLLHCSRALRGPAHGLLWRVWSWPVSGNPYVKDPGPAGT